MSMTTQCPDCGTRFRVTPQHLQSQQGLVRCGRCATVFDGFKALATLPEQVTSPPPVAVLPVPVVIPEEPAVNEALVTLQTPERENALPASVETGLQVPDVAPLQSPAAPLLLADELQADNIRIAEIPADQPSATHTDTSVSAPQNGLDAPPSSEDDAGRENTLESALAPEALNPHESNLVPPRFVVPPAVAPAPAPAPRKRTLLWAGGALLMLCVLGVQMVYWYRSELAASLPETRPLLGAACKYLQCSVDLPQRPRQLTIEASDMQAADPANPGLVILTATLRNQAAVTLGFPALDVVLTNTREHTVARRIFLPAEYLSERNDWRAGMAPSAEVTIRLHIDSGDLGAAGFRLDLMAAPAG